MILYEFECLNCGYRMDVWFEIKDRNSPVYCACGTTNPKTAMIRVPGGSVSRDVNA